MPRAGPSPPAARATGLMRVKEVASTVEAVSIQVSCRRFRISGRCPFTNPSLEGAAGKLRPPLLYPEPERRNIHQSRSIIGVGGRGDNLSEGSRTTGVMQAKRLKGK